MLPPGQYPPSDREFDALRRELAEILGEREISLGEVFDYESSDKVLRTGRVFSWLPDAAIQMSLLDGPETAVPLTYE